MKSVGLNPVVVHGGGPQISQAIERAGLQPKFVDGLRVTDWQTMDIVEKVVIQNINCDLVDMIIEAGWDAFGLGGSLQGGFIQAKKNTDNCRRSSFRRSRRIWICRRSTEN